MGDLLETILNVLRGMWRFRWPAVIAAWSVALVGFLGVLALPDVYTARTRMYLDTETILRPLLSGITVQRDVAPQVRMMSTVLLSGPTLENVARQTDLFASAVTPAQREGVIATLRKNIEVTPVASAQNTFEIAVKHHDARKAHQIVDTLLNTFIRDTLGLKRSDSGLAQNFIKQQLSEYEAKLSAAEERLAAFKKQNVGVMPGEGGDYYGRLQERKAALDTLRIQYGQLSSRAAELQKQIAGEEPTLGFVAPPEASALDGQIAGLKARRDQLLVQYTEKHPEVLAIAEQISRLEEQRAAEMSRSRRATGGQVVTTQGLAAKVLDVNPVYQSMRIALSQTEAQMAEVRGQIAAEESQAAYLRSRVDSIPQVEAELVKLTRDYDINKKQYEDLLQRLESARLSESVDSNTENVKFRIIEPPLVPVAPSGPARALLLTAVLFLALGVGFGLAFVLHEVRPAFASRKTLQQVTGLTVLGSISLLPGPDAGVWYRRAPAIVAASVGGLVFFYLIAIAASSRIPSVLARLTG